MVFTQQKMVSTERFSMVFQQIRPMILLTNRTRLWYLNYFGDFRRNISSLRLCKLVRKQTEDIYLLMDNDSSQTRKSAKTALQDIEAEFHEIPPC